MQKDLGWHRDAVSRDACELEHIGTPGPQARRFGVHQHLAVIFFDAAGVIALERAPAATLLSILSLHFDAT